MHVCTGKFGTVFDTQSHFWHKYTLRLVHPFYLEIKCTAGAFMATL